MAKTPSTMLELGTKAPDFKLPDTEGQWVSRDDFRGKKGLLVLFICNHCPYVIHIASHLARMTKEYMARGIPVVAINSNDATKYPDDAPDKMKEEKAKRGYAFPYLFDETQKVAQAYQAACTPDIFLFDKNFELAYRGQYDGSRPSNNVPVTGSDLKKALDALLADQKPSAEQTPSIGCNIKWRAGNEPSYYG